MLRDIYFDLVKTYCSDPQLISTLWLEIQSHYGGKSRYYHTLSHLEDLIDQLNNLKADIVDWDIVLFAVFYHDIIYNATKGGNEKRSADLAGKRLKQIDYPQHKTSKCMEMILATKKHSATGDTDIDHFTDADLSILGQPWDKYKTYYKQIRNEYSFYPDLLYNSGRKKVLRHFLNMHRIFKTDHFFIKFEAPARKNLSQELALL